MTRFAELKVAISDRVLNLKLFENGTFRGIDEASGMAKVDYDNGSKQLAKLDGLVKVI